MNNKEYIRKHYQANKEYYKEKAKVRNSIIIKSNRLFVNRYKVYKGCVDCGYKSHPEALHLDHVYDNKTMAVASLISRASSRARVKDEIRKCVVRCANCHAIVTAERRLSK